MLVMRARRHRLREALVVRSVARKRSTRLAAQQQQSMPMRGRACLHDSGDTSREPR